MDATSGVANRISRARILGVIAGVAWIFVVLVNYYIVHKPFGMSNALALLNDAANILVPLTLYLLAAALGHRLLARLTFAAPLEALVFQTGIGLGAVSFAMFALGLAGVLDRWILWGCVLGALALLRDDVRGLWQDLRGLVLVRETRFEKFLSLYVLIVLALGALAALTPTLAWDAQLYHLNEGKVALAQGRIGPPPDILSFSDPSLLEMLYLAVMALKGDGGTALVHLGYAALTLGSLLAFARRFLTTQVGWLAAALILAVPSFVLVSTWPYNDAGLAFYAFAAVYALLVALEQSDGKWLVLAGVLAGLALGMKVTASIIPLALVLLLLLARRPILDLLRLTVPCALVGAPWYIRNWIFTGNPVYPYFFPGRYWDEFRALHYSTFGSGLIREPLRILTAPLEATIFGQEGTTSFEATIGPLLLILLPFLLLLWRERRDQQTGNAVRALLVYSGILYLFWLLGATLSGGLAQTRLLFPAFPTLALLAAFAFDRLPALDLPQFSLMRFARLLVVLVLTLTLLAQALDWVALNPLPYLAGYETREHFISTRVNNGYWDALQAMSRLPGARVYFLWEPRDYYAPASAVTQTDEILDNWGHLRYLYADAAGITRGLRAQGYTHILIARAGMEFALNARYGGARPDDVRMVKELVTNFARQVYGAQPLDYTLDAEGMLHVNALEQEPYSIYELVVP